MLIIDRMAEGRLLERLHTLRQQPDLFRCLHVALHHHPDQVSDRVIQIVADQAAEPDNVCYVCEDGDLFLIGRKINYKTVSALMEVCAYLTSNQLALYDLTHSWAHVIKLGDDKFQKVRARLEAEQKQSHAQEQLRKREEILDSKPEQLVLETMHARRNRHIKPDVLVVEDDAFSAKLVDKALREKCSVTVAQDGQSALALHAVRAPHMVRLDINMPDVSGLEILPRLLAIDPDAYVIMLSGNSDRDNVMKAIQMGAKGFIGKPFTREKLLQYLKKCPLLTPELVSQL
jgi:two-component system chemotaxis response regulator CheY